MHPANTPPTGRKLDALTSLRFFAAMHVVAFHYAEPLLTSAPGPIRTFVQAGYEGVSFFFVLSGFVLAYNYARPGGELRGTLRAFFASRFARVYPLYFISLLLWAPVPFAHYLGGVGLLKGGIKLAVSGVAYAGLLQAWVPWTLFIWNPPSWSVSCELFFYLSFPSLLNAIGRMRPRAAMAFGVTAWAIGLAIPAVYLGLSGVSPSVTTGHGAAFGVVKYHPVTHLHEFAIGVAAAVLFLQRTPAHERFFARWSPALLLGGLLGLVSVLAWATAFPHLLVHNGLLVPLYLAIIVGIAFGGGRVARALAWSPLVLLGNASYAMYILQAPFFSWAERITSRLPLSGASPGPVLLVELAVFLALCVLAFRFVEEPLRDRLRHLSGRRRPAPAPAIAGADVAE